MMKLQSKEKTAEGDLIRHGHQLFIPTFTIEKNKTKYETIIVDHAMCAWDDACTNYQ
jgi:hypothetical protein